MLARAFRGAGWAVFREQCDVNHVLHVAGRGFDAYLAGRMGTRKYADPSSPLAGLI